MSIEDRLKRLKEGKLEESHTMIERHRLRREAKEYLRRLIILAENWSLIKPRRFTRGIYIRKKLSS
jgi:hypothetical protein